MKAELAGGSLPRHLPFLHLLLPRQLSKGLYIYTEGTHTHKTLFRVGSARSLEFLKSIGSARHNSRACASLARGARIETFLLSFILTPRERPALLLFVLPRFSVLLNFIAVGLTNATNIHLANIAASVRKPLPSRRERLPADSLPRARFLRCFFPLPAEKRRSSGGADPKTQFPMQLPRRAIASAIRLSRAFLSLVSLPLAVHFAAGISCEARDRQEIRFVREAKIR